MEKDKKIKFPSKNAKGKEIEIGFLEITGILCYEEAERSELGFIMSIQ